MSFKTVFTCPRCNRRTTYDGIVEKSATKSQEVWVGIYVGKDKYSPVKTSVPEHLCQICAGKFAELMTRVADKFLKRKEEKVTAGAGLSRLKRLVDNNNVEEQEILAEATAEIDAMSEVEVKIPGNTRVQGFFCTTCGMGVDGKRPGKGEGHVNIGVHLKHKKGKLVPRALCSSYNHSYNQYNHSFRNLQLVVNGAHRYMYGSNMSVTMTRFAEYPKTAEAETFCSNCGPKAQVGIVYEGEGTVTGPGVAADFVKRLNNKDLRLST